jgi:hypothetical protein
MKKIFFCLIILILGFGIVSSAEIELKNEFVKGETLIAKVSGNFVKQPIKDNMEFFRRHMSTSMGFYDVIKIEGDYYIYVNIPLEKEADNYSLVISGVEYYSGTKIIDEDLVANFTILDEQASFSINPVLFITEEDYIIELQNLVDTKIEIIYEKLTKEEADVIAVEEDKPTFFESLFGLFEKQNVSEPEEQISGEIISLKSGEIVEVTIPIGDYVGFEKVKFVYENETYNSMIYILGKEKIVENETPDEPEVEMNETPDEPEVENCEEFNGTICKSNEKCEGETKYSSTDICCVGECVKVEKSNIGKTIGWIIIIVLALFLTWFFKNKYSKSRPPEVDLEEESKNKK